MFMGLAHGTCLQLDKCVVLFDRFFSVEFLVELNVTSTSCAALRFVVCLHCVVLCCYVL